MSKHETNDVYIGINMWICIYWRSDHFIVIGVTIRGHYQYYTKGTIGGGKTWCVVGDIIDLSDWLGMAKRCRWCSRQSFIESARRTTPRYSQTCRRRTSRGCEDTEDLLEGKPAKVSCLLFGGLILTTQVLLLYILLGCNLYYKVYYSKDIVWHLWKTSLNASGLLCFDGFARTAWIFQNILAHKVNGRRGCKMLLLLPV